MPHRFAAFEWLDAGGFRFPALFLSALVLRLRSYLDVLTHFSTRNSSQKMAMSGLRRPITSDG